MLSFSNVPRETMEVFNVPRGTLSNKYCIHIQKRGKLYANKIFPGKYFAANGILK
jgi:hypothetical protein